MYLFCIDSMEKLFFMYGETDKFFRLRNLNFFFHC